MVTIRWISGKGKVLNVRDQQFPTKRDALGAIASALVKSIKKIPNQPGGRMYAVEIKSASSKS